MNQKIIDMCGQVGNFHSTLDTNHLGVDSKITLKDEKDAFDADRILMDGWMERASVNVLGIAVDKTHAKFAHGHEWDLINADARPYADIHGLSELFGKFELMRI